MTLQPANGTTMQVNFNGNTGYIFSGIGANGGSTGIVNFADSVDVTL
jgi:hypothetical protein